MSDIFVQDDIADSVLTALSGHPHILIVEAAVQPVDRPLRTGWDFLAPKEARQFYFNDDGRWALVVIRRAGNEILFHVPAHDAKSDAIADPIAILVRCIVQSEDATSARRDPDRAQHDLVSDIEARLAFLARS